jgi:succinate-semialdehyde dehydrogenase / glutarate-semialdehyde dehydrogenase
VSLQTRNPATGDVLDTYTEQTAAEVHGALDQAVAAQARWRGLGYAHRARGLMAVAEALESRADQFARLMALEMGKPLAQGVAESKKSASVCRYYAEHAEAFLADQPIAMDSGSATVTHAPLGVILGIMPWNFPLWQVLRFAAPTLMAGNTALIKHAPNVTGTALALAQLFDDVGLGGGLYTALVIDLEPTAKVIADPRVAAVSLTGSVRAGRSVAAQAGQAVKKCVLELGGSDAYVVLDDADIEQAATACVTFRFVNGGQSCVAAKRWIVTAAARPAFEAAVRAQLAAQVVGDPFDSATTIGPMARDDLREQLHDQVQASIAAGARCVMGGVLPAGTGSYYPVTLLTDPPAGSPAYSDELFGPVATLIEVPDAEAALKVANDTVYGLGGAVFSRDVEAAETFARQLHCGAVGINRAVVSDPRLPFGGVGHSGYGRELSRHGLMEFVNVRALLRA